MRNWRPSAALKAFFIGRARDLSDRRLFHKISLVAVLAWIGLGADGLSSSCYTVFALQRRFYRLGLPFMTLPIRVSDKQSVAVTDLLQTA